jgi:hypothetical protein
MGWGEEPHEGWAYEKLPDGRWLGPTRCGGDPDPVAAHAVCGCGWRSEREHPLPPRPANTPRDYCGLRYGPEYDAPIVGREAADDACEDCNAEHYEALLGHEPHMQLIRGCRDGGPRRYLDGKPVHPSGTLELLTDSEDWLPVRYEWDCKVEQAQQAYFNLGLPAPARGVTELPDVSVALPSTVILGWRSRDELTGRQ